MIMLTIQPGPLFSAAVVSWFRDHHYRDDDVAAHLDQLERDDMTPVEVVRAWKFCGIPSHVVIALVSAAGGIQ